MGQPVADGVAWVVDRGRSLRAKTTADSDLTVKRLTARQKPTTPFRKIGCIIPLPFTSSGPSIADDIHGRHPQVRHVRHCHLAVPAFDEECDAVQNHVKDYSAPIFKSVPQPHNA